MDKVYTGRENSKLINNKIAPSISTLSGAFFLITSK